MKFLKYTAIFVGVIILLVVGAIIALTTFVNPNRFKPMLEKQAAAYTGRTVTIDGDLSWTVFPSLGVKVGHIVMSNPVGFKQPVFAEIAGATLSVNVMPLFHGQIESKGILLKGMTLNLIKNAQGQVNWNLQPANAVQDESKPETTESGSVNAAPLGLMISNIDISDATVISLDEKTHQTYQVKHVNVRAKDINLFHAFPFSAAFDFAVDNKASGHVNFDSNVSLDVANKIYSLNQVNLAADIKADSKNINLKLNGDIKADMNQQRVDWLPFEGQIANMPLVGSMRITQLSSAPAIAGQVTIKPFDLQDFLHQIGQPVDAIQEARDVAGQIDFLVAGGKESAKGVITIDSLQTAKVRMEKVNANWHLQDRTVYLDSLTSHLYEGNMKAQGKLDLTTGVPQISAKGDLSNVQAEPLFQDLTDGKQKLKLKGLANANVAITTSGINKNAILQNLNGTAAFNFANGVIEGIDIGYLVNNAYSFVHKRALTDDVNSNQTNFGSFKGTAVIQRGIVSTNDLLLDSSRFQTNGKGTVNLVNEQLNLSLVTSPKDVAKLEGMTIPVLVKGTLSDPSIRLDTEALVSAVAKEQVQSVKEKVQDKIQQKIQDKLPGDAGQVFKNLLGN